MFEISVATGDALGVFNFEVEVFGGSVGDAGVVEVSEQLGMPGMERAAKLGDLGDRAAPQLGDQLGGPGAGLVGLGDLVEGHQVLGDGPGQGGLAGGVASDQAGVESGTGLGGQPVAAPTQHAADAIERVAGAAAVAGGVLLNPAANLIQAGQAELDHMEGIKYPRRVGQLGGQRAGIAPKRIQRRGDNPRPPVRLAGRQPAGQYRP
jgi:hypothetical protein